MQIPLMLIQDCKQTTIHAGLVKSATRFIDICFEPLCVKIEKSLYFTILSVGYDTAELKKFSRLIDAVAIIYHVLSVLACHSNAIFN